MGSETVITIVPGEAPEWREFASEDYDPEAAPGSDDDELGELIAERAKGESFGVIVVAEPMEVVSDGLLKRLAANRIPTKVRRESRDEEKAGEKKEKKHKK